LRSLERLLVRSALGAANVRLAFEIVLITCVLAAIAFQPSFRAWLASASRPFVAVCALLVAGLVVGHLARAKTRSFPFLYWHMYTQPQTAEVIEHLEITATTAGGEQLELNGAKIFPSLGLGTFRLYSRLLAIAYDPDLARKPDAHQLLRGIARGYEQLHPEQVLTSIALEIVVSPYKAQRRERRAVATVALR
jgi:hypothetical protein